MIAVLLCSWQLAQQSVGFVLFFLLAQKTGETPGQRGYFLLVVGFFVLFYFNFFVVVCFNVILLTRIAAVKWLIVNIHLLSESVHV